MKKLIFVSTIICSATAYAAAPSTTCPVGFVAVVEEHMTVANSSCPSGTTSVGTAASCLASPPEGSCMMFAPTGKTYSDNTANYEFTEVCPLS